MTTGETHVFHGWHDDRLDARHRVELHNAVVAIDEVGELVLFPV